MATAMDVAHYLIRAAAEQPEPDFLTNLRLQKLLYYAQGWHIAIFGPPLFPERIEAWKHGPVVPAVYRSFSFAGRNHLEPPEGDHESLTPEQERLLAQLWAGFRQYSATALYHMTHRERPWQEARAGLPPDAHGSAEVSLTTMAEVFKSQIGGVNPKEIWEAYENSFKTPSIPAEEAFKQAGWRQ